MDHVSFNCFLASSKSNDKIVLGGTGEGTGDEQGRLARIGRSRIRREGRERRRYCSRLYELLMMLQMRIR